MIWRFQQFFQCHNTSEVIASHQLARIPILSLQYNPYFLPYQDSSGQLPKRDALKIDIQDLACSFKPFDVLTILQS